MLTIWGRKTSSNVQALMWCVGELGLTFKRYDVGHRYGGNDTREFLAMNPNGTIPVLVDDDGAPIWETGAILRYLATSYADVAFWPTEASARAVIDMWADWAKINIALEFTGPIFWRVVPTAPKDIDWLAVRLSVAKLAKVFDIAEARLAKTHYLCGDALTLADIQFGHVLYRYFDIDIERPSHPAVLSYYKRLTDRSAFCEHVMVSYEELRVV
jgi:glutathione S-transferase